jgi:UDPglucose 6-dehydrogenase
VACISVIGTGYVGLVSGTMFAELGHVVCCCDSDSEKIKNIENGVMPIYEPGLKALVEKNKNEGRLVFCSDIEDAVKRGDSIFIAVGTPMGENHMADLSAVYEVARSIGRHMDAYKVIVDKSTVPVGTAKEITKIIDDELKRRELSIDFEVVSNPEFLREGTAVNDFSNPERIVVGVRSEKAQKMVEEVYAPLTGRGVELIVTTPETAEMIKYACNAFLAVKIAYINEFSGLCEVTGANVQDVAYAMGLDARIAPQFLQVGPGFGGSCFPKDTRAISATAKQHGLELRLVDSAIEANEAQKERMYLKIKKELGNVAGLTLSFLGVTFKPGTDDMRDAPALTIIPKLAADGAKIRIYDPKGSGQAKQYFSDIETIVYEYDAMSAVKDADAAILLTHWEEFKTLNYAKVRSAMKGDVFFDLRNFLDVKLMKNCGFKYIGVGK